MYSGNGPYGRWSERQPSGPRRFLPIAGTFSHTPDHSSQRPALDSRYDRQFNPGDVPVPQFVSPQQLFLTPQESPTSASFQQPQSPFSSVSQQDGLQTTFTTNGPVVHEGFIPAPGQDEEDDMYPGYPSGRQDYALWHSRLQTSSEEDSDDEDGMLREVAEKDDPEKDKDYSLSEDDPDEELYEEELDDEDEPTFQRQKRKSKPPSGGRRGRPSLKAKGGFRGTVSTRGRKTGARGRQKGPRGPRAPADPGPEFKELQRQANEAFMRRNFDEAMDFANQAVKLNPEIFSAHNTLSEIYSAMDREPQSIYALIVGAPTLRNKPLWWHIIDRIEKVDPKKYPEFTDELKATWYLNCLREIIKLDSENYDARSRKLDLEAELGHVSACVKLCRKMLDIRPHQYDILKQMAIIGTSSAKHTRLHLSRIIKSYDHSISYFVNHGDPSTSKLDWSLLNIYLDLLDKAGDYDYALDRLKVLSRWKQKRQEEVYWDDQDDDREFDLEDAPRRIAVSEFKRTSRRVKYGKTLPMEIRVKMGLFRLRQIPCKFAEAMVCTALYL